MNRLPNTSQLVEPILPRESVSLIGYKVAWCFTLSNVVCTSAASATWNRTDHYTNRPLYSTDFSMYSYECILPSTSRNSGIKLDTRTVSFSIPLFKVSFRFACMSVTCWSGNAEQIYVVSSSMITFNFLMLHLTWFYVHLQLRNVLMVSEFGD